MLFGKLLFQIYLHSVKSGFRESALLGKISRITLLDYPEFKMVSKISMVFFVFNSFLVFRKESPFLTEMRKK